MSLYIPPECAQFLNVCTTQQVFWGYFLGGLMIGIMFALIVPWLLRRGLLLGTPPDEF